MNGGKAEDSNRLWKQIVKFVPYCQGTYAEGCPQIVKFVPGKMRMEVIGYDPNSTGESGNLLGTGEGISGIAKNKRVCSGFHSILPAQFGAVLPSVARGESSRGGHLAPLEGFHAREGLQAKHH